LLGLTPRRGGVVHVTVTGKSSRAHRGIVVHRVRELDPRDQSTAQNIPIVGVAHTLVDFATVASYNETRRAVREAQARELVSVVELTRTLSRLPQRPGNRAVRKIIATGPAPTKSELEDIVLDLVLVGGFAHPEVNKPLIIEGRRIVPDLRWPAQRLIIEADSRRWHDDPISRQDDAERQALLEAAGERVLRVRWVEAVGRPEETLARVGRAGAPAAR
jgi:hypothetical protein